jgi:predicted lipid-binding transport protein (Tim44 family)
MTSSTSPQTSTSTQASTPTDQSAPRSEPESRKGGWAGGLTVFAGVILATIGVFQFLQGLAAIIKGSFYVVAPNNIYEFSVSGWGWIHLVLGIVLVLQG